LRGERWAEFPSFAWGAHPTYSEGTALQWGAGLILVLLIAFVWARIPFQLAE
jgi:hypothetical protein